MIELEKWNFDNKIMCWIKIQISSMQNGIIPIYNMSPYYGMIMNMLENYNAPHAKALHNKEGSEHKYSMPFTFGILKIPHASSDIKGFYRIEKDAIGTLIIKTIDPIIVEAIISAYKHKNAINFNKASFIIQKLQIKDYTEDIMPDNWNIATISMHSATILNLAKTKVPFNAESLLLMQINKMKMMGIINESIDPNDYTKYVRTLKDYTTSGFLSMTSYDDNESSRLLAGRIGNLVIKVSGDENIREFVWFVLKVSEFIGIGRRSSIGFGHNSVKFK